MKKVSIIIPFFKGQNYIVEAVEGFQKEPTCFFGFETCPMDDHCSMHEVWAASQDEMIKVLSKTKLIDVKFDNINI